jgi:hypothetical protein
MKTQVWVLIVFALLLSACSGSATDACEASNVGVRYVLTGEGVSTVAVTQSSDTAGMEVGDLAVPYCRTMTGFAEGDPLYISATIDGDAGSVTCKIYDGPQLLSSSTVRAREGGFAAIATCTATK